MAGAAPNKPGIIQNFSETAYNKELKTTSLYVVQQPILLDTKQMRGMGWKGWRHCQYAVGFARDRRLRRRLTSKTRKNRRCCEWKIRGVMSRRGLARAITIISCNRMGDCMVGKQHWRPPADRCLTKLAYRIVCSLSKAAPDRYDKMVLWQTDVLPATLRLSE